MGATAIRAEELTKRYGDVRCHVSGPVASLLKVLAAEDVTHLVSREPSLEELFLALYGGSGQGAPHSAR